ncbi:MAG: glycosyltransferase family 1 protein [Desulfosarcinaceae bacterium]
MLAPKGNQRKINILIEATKLVSDNADGIHRYVHELLSALAKLVDSHGLIGRVDIFTSRGLFYSISPIRDLYPQKQHCAQLKVAPTKLRLRMAFQRMKDAIRRQVEHLLSETQNRRLKKLRHPLYRILCRLDPNLRFNSYNVVHLTQPQSYIHFQNCRAKMVTTVHDLTHLYFPQFHLQENIDDANHGMQLAIKKHSEFIAVSNATRENLLAAYPVIDPGRIHVVHEACDNDRFRPVDEPERTETVCIKYGIPAGPFFLSLSTIEPRKNILNAVDAFLLMCDENPDPCIRLVIAGKTGWKHDALMQRVAQKPDRIIITGFVEEFDLPALYSAAVALIYVSFCEGFGLPPLEAMSCGTPVVYGDNSAMREVIGKGGLAANPNDILDIKENLKKMAADRSTRDLLGKTARQRSKQFSWDRAARQTLDVYKTLVRPPHA